MIYEASQAPVHASIDGKSLWGEDDQIDGWEKRSDVVHDHKDVYLMHEYVLRLFLRPQVTSCVPTRMRSLYDDGLPKFMTQAWSV